MAKSEWGAKHVCESCGLKYYDMQRDPIVCPSCGEKAVIAITRPRRNRGVAKPEPKPAPAASSPAASSKDDVAEKEDSTSDDVSVKEDGGEGGSEEKGS